MANLHQRNNAMEVMHACECICLNHLALKDHIVNFYEKLFWEECIQRPKLDVSIFEFIDQSIGVVGKSFCKRGGSRDKAPNQGGFSMAFFQTC